MPDEPRKRKGEEGGAPHAALALEGSPPLGALEQRPAGTCTSCHQPAAELFALYEDPALFGLTDEELDEREQRGLPGLICEQPAPDEKPVELACIDCIRGPLAHDIDFLGGDAAPDPRRQISLSAQRIGGGRRG